MSKIEKNEFLIGLISDTHIPSRTPKIPQEIINDFLDRKVDYIFHLGDYTTLNVYNDLINTFGKEKIIGVSGNMDEQKISSQLPKTRDISILNHKVFLTHGSGGPDGIIERLNNNYDLFKYDIVIFGHIHRPIHEKRDGKLYLNPGTPTDKRFTKINSYAYLKLSKNNVDFKIKYL